MDTQEDKIDWVRETVAELEKLEVVDDGQGYPSVNHPILQYKKKEQKIITFVIQYIILCSIVIVVLRYVTTAIIRS